MMLSFSVKLGTSQSNYFDASVIFFQMAHFNSSWIRKAFQTTQNRLQLHADLDRNLSYLARSSQQTENQNIQCPHNLHSAFKKHVKHTAK